MSFVENRNEKNIERLDAKEEADFLGAHLETIRRLARKGEIPSYKIGKDWRFRRKSLANWAETHHLRRKAITVLVIDEDAAARKTIRHLLESDGYRVLLSPNGAEGLAWLNREPVDLILFDLNMAGMNGSKFFEKTREASQTIPVVVVTGHPDAELMATALRHGPFTLLAKPIDREHLRQAARTALMDVRRVEKRST